MPYIGTSPSNGVRRKHTYTATASQTSFSGAGAEGATLSYNDSNFVDVYQNGVKLSEADYTSTSGTAIVLAQGASVSDIVEVVVYDVFSVADTVSKSAGGTFDGNVTMAGTLDVAGIGTFTDDIIIGDGKTIGSASKVDAITIASSGLVQLTSTGIGAGSQVFQVIDDGATLFQIRSEDGNISFPQSGAGIYLGVTSGNAANLLDDYEEGTWTPAVTFGGGATGVSYTTNTNGRYIKVGDSVTVTGCLFLDNKGSSTGDAVITGLPFAHRNGSEGTKASGSIGQTNISFTAFPSILGSGSSLGLFDTTTGGTLGAIDNSNFSNSSSVYFSASYATA